MKCKQCYRYFDTPIQMARHVKKTHPKINLGPGPLKGYSEDFPLNSAAVVNGDIDFDAIQWCIDQAEQWEGMETGDPDAIELLKIRANAANARLALALLKQK